MYQVRLAARWPLPYRFQLCRATDRGFMLTWGTPVCILQRRSTPAVQGEDGGLIAQPEDSKCLQTEGTVWQPDGWSWRARIGILTPHADIGPESEFQAMAPDGISIHAARVPLGVYTPGGTMDPTIAEGHVRAFADPPLIDDAAELLAAAPLHAIVFGFISSSYVRGAADDAALKRRLEERTGAYRS